jgi:ribosomal-protein-alanine N-acetyltransferase
VNNLEVSVTRVARDDAAALIAANRDNKHYHHPWTSPFTDQSGFDNWFARMVSGGGVSMVARATGGEIIGVITLSQIVMGDFCSCYCGFYGMRNQTGRGLMTAALRRVIAIAWTELGLHRIEANIQPDNHRSIALVRRAGFSLEGFSPRYLKINGEWRDHERWALIKEVTNQ